MKTIQLSTIYIFLGMLSVQPAFPQEAWQLTGKAWSALGNNNFDEVERLANEAVRRWGENARKRNNGLSKLPSTKEAKGYATLNELATIVWLKGEALLKKGDREGALAVTTPCLLTSIMARPGTPRVGTGRLRLHVVTASPNCLPRVSKSFLWILHRCQRSSSFLVRRGFVLHCVKKERRGVGLIIFLELMRLGLIGITRGDRVV